MMSVDTSSSSKTKCFDVPKVEINYAPVCKSSNVQLAFVSMRSQTTLCQSIGRYQKAWSKYDFNNQAMKCKEFSFHDLTEKAQTAHGFRKGKVVECKSRLGTSNSFYEDFLIRNDRKKKKSEEFSIAGQKVNFSKDLSGPNVMPPREWIVEKSRTLPDIKAPNPTPITFFKPLNSDLKEEKLNVSLESVAYKNEEIGENESNNLKKDMIETEPKKDNGDTLPKITDSVEDSETTMRGVTVSLQTDDYLYYNNETGGRPITSQSSRPVKYQTVKVITPTTNKLPQVHERRSFASRETPRTSRKAFPSFRNSHTNINDNVTRAASKQKLGKLSTSLPLLPHTK